MSEFPDFDDLASSTATVMVYSNMIFDKQNIFSNIPLSNAEISFTKKHKKIDKKKINAPSGTIFSTQLGKDFRGLDLRKKVILEGQEVIKYFRNQVMVYISLGFRYNLNIMIFKDNFKIAGCKRVEDAFEAVKILWEKFINPLKSSKFKDNETQPKFLFSPCMKNNKFCLGFDIDLRSLNILLNKDEYKNHISLSQYEPINHPNVNIKMSHIYSDPEYDLLVYNSIDSNKSSISSVLENPYKNKKKKSPEKETTMIVFSSSQVILTGKYSKNSKRVYNLFIDIIKNNKEEIKEKIKLPEKEFKFD